MKNQFLFLVALLLFGHVGFAENMEVLIKRNQRGALPNFPVADVRDFSALQQAACDGDVSAQKKLPALLIAHVKEVYQVLSTNGGLLFSVRHPVRGYDAAANNYAVNLDRLFEQTTDSVRVKKQNFPVTTTNGTVFQVRYPEYRPRESSIEVIKEGQPTQIALSDLAETDQRFLRNIFMDESFKSSQEVVISSKDVRLDEKTYAKEKISKTHRETGEFVEGSFVSATAQGVSRTIVLENKGRFPIENLVVEYQSFAEQTIMKMPKDFPSDYRCAGFFEIGALDSGERKEFLLEIPETVEARQETVHSGDYQFYRRIPSDRNQRSEGRVKGVWVKVHRFTPYGEKLTREYKSAGVPNVDWVNVASAGADIR